MLSRRKPCNKRLVRHYDDILDTTHYLVSCVFLVYQRGPFIPVLERKLRRSKIGAAVNLSL